MTELEVDDLLKRYETGECTPAERAIVQQWVTDLANNAMHPNQLTEAQSLLLANQVWAELQKTKQFKALPDKVQVGQSEQIVKLWPKIAIAASMVLVLGALGVLLSRYVESDKKDSQTLYAENDIPAGKNRATLRLANGQTIQLSSAKTGVVIDNENLSYNDGSAIVSATASSRKTLGNGEEGRNEQMTLSTPRGGEYQIKLADGTQVWLNAGSSITYPASFAGLKERRIILAGEAYFSVHHDSKQPFKVVTANQTVEDIGTEFNINGYTDEPSIKTTLIKGSASVNGTILKPSQQSALRGEALQVTTVDPEEAIAWKEGQFVFTSEPIPSILRRIARWYDVTIQYNGNFADEKFTGTISRYATAAEVLQTLELTQGIHFKIEGRKIIVSN